MASMLKGVATHWVKADEATLAKMSQRIRRLAVDQKGLTRKNRDRLRPIEDPAKQKVLVQLPLRLRDLVVRGKIPLHSCSVMAQVAVAVEILLFCAIRIGNLAAIDIDRHLVRVGRKLHLVIPAEEVKNEVDLEFELADDTASLLDWYIKEQRSAPAGCRALFPGRNGGCKSVSTLRGQIIKTIRDHTGLEVHPHLFRHIGAQIYLTQHPGGYEVMRRVFGHKSMATTTNSYTGLQTRSATAHFGNTMMDIRRPPDREQVV